ncbi:MAG: hypothetical protein ACR5LD_11095 [Symbiopectobacterium sp.]
MDLQSTTTLALDQAESITTCAWSLLETLLGLNVSAEHLQDSEFIADIRQFAANVAAQPLFDNARTMTERSLTSKGAEVA